MADKLDSFRVILIELLKNAYSSLDTDAFKAIQKKWDSHIDAFIKDFETKITHEDVITIVKNELIGQNIITDSSLNQKLADQAIIKALDESIISSNNVLNTLKQKSNEKFSEYDKTITYLNSNIQEFNRVDQESFKKFAKHDATLSEHNKKIELLIKVSGLPSLNSKSEYIGMLNDDND